MPSGVTEETGRYSRTPHGVRGLKYEVSDIAWKNIASHPTRGAWIEILEALTQRSEVYRSHPTRGAWIEMYAAGLGALPYYVAPHTGCVD